MDKGLSPERSVTNSDILMIFGETIGLSITFFIDSFKKLTARIVGTIILRFSIFELTFKTLSATSSKNVFILK